MTLRMEDGCVMGDITILENLPGGRVILDEIEKGYKHMVMPTCIGDVNDDNIVKNITFDRATVVPDGSVDVGRGRKDTFKLKDDDDAEI